jgi:hypothetical protein
MKKITYIIISIICLAGLSGCKFLDMTPTDSVSDKLVWANTTYAEYNINSFYHYIDALGQFDTGQSNVGITEGMTDELKYGCTSLNVHMWFANEIAYNENGQGIPVSTAAFYLGSWSYLYGNIESINQAIADLELYKTNFSDEDYNRLMGECRFFRGWMYFELTKRSQQCILYDEDMSKYQRNTPLNSEKECWDFVEADLEYAVANLPQTSSTHRLTSGAANALLSRAMLYAERWDVAQKAADAVIDSGVYSLMSSYTAAWSTLAKDGNTEAILDYEYNKEGVTHNFNDNFTPGGDVHSSINAKGTPTQEMVESYELAKGGFPDWSAWHTTSGTATTPPWDKLEPRFAATILYNGCSWKGRSIEAYVGGADGFQAWKVKPTTDGMSTTGYFLRKLLDESWDYSVYDRSLEPWIAIRYAEVLLNGAEAYCHGDNANASKARGYVNQVRARVNLPKLTSSGDDLLSDIMHERKVELAFEGQQYWDMRRWKRSESEYSNYRVHGIRIDKTTAGYTYTYVEADDVDRQFSAKLYQIPLPQDELENNSAVKQFSVWN